MKMPKILVVEDDHIMRMVVAGFAEHIGCHLTSVETCDEALGLLAEEAFDLVLMDWQMIGTDGLECAAEIRSIEIPMERRTPIVAMTANVMPGHRDLALAAGMDDFLGKPFTMAEFQEMVARFCSK